MPACLQIQNLSKSYPHKPVFREVRLELQSGARILLCGPSGAGKSTLLRIIAGLETADQGVIRLAGALASSGCKTLIPPHKRQQAVVFQDSGLWPNLTAWGNVMLGLSSLKLSKSEKRERTA